LEKGLAGSKREWQMFVARTSNRESKMGIGRYWLLYITDWRKTRQNRTLAEVDERGWRCWEWRNGALVGSPEMG
jgi:hypothetical protein